ncbi:MAG: hypothetical protein NZM12_03545 [Steroidobacteraceae bacterium]|nr:hypothetical protein [Steroidobacteraceae bacterium]MDW8259023.1 DUF4139 domain-containing protein [Gammaproteobacteria bacterium]
MRPWPTVLSVTALSAAVAGSAQSVPVKDDTALTIYSSAQPGAVAAQLYRPLLGGAAPNASAVPGYALVRHDRPMRIDAGRSTLRFTDVAALIDPTTVTFASLTEPSTRVLEQNFQFDLVSTDKLLQKYVDRSITIERALGTQAQTVTGTLLSSVDGLVLRGNDGNIHALRDYASLRFGELPGGLITRPTLEWQVMSPKGGEQRTRVTYQTGGMTWWADYNLVFAAGGDANSGLLDLSAWVSIVNLSGATYADARLKLIAGDVHRAETPEAVGRARMAVQAAMSDEAGGGFEQKEFFEFHLYTLGRRTTLPNNSTKQIELFDQARKIPARKTLVYYGVPAGFAFGGPYTDRDLGTPMNKKVDVYLEFRNDKQYGLGVPLPAGRIRVAQLDAADGSLEFIGEDRIDHTPKDEQVRIKLGSAFDVVGERRQIDFAVDSKARWLEEEIEIKLRNHKSQPVDVLVRETLYRWSNWRIVAKSHEFERDDARTIHFPVRVAKDGETVVRYRVRYTW